MRGCGTGSSALGMAGDVVFDNGFLDEERLHRLVAASDVVLLPYDSREQVTSGVLIEAVAAARPVVSTRFPHAVELLDSGSGLLVDHGDPNAIAAALRRVLTEPGLARCHVGTFAPDRALPVLGERRRALPGDRPRSHGGPPHADPDGVGRRTTGRMGGDGVTPTAPPFSHLLAMSDDTGLFEHARFTRPRIEHGYCVDDVARGLIVLSRNGGEAVPGELTRLAWTYLRFLADSQDAQGRIVNRCDVEDVRRGEHGVEDCWGRALWGLGSVGRANRRHGPGRTGADAVRGRASPAFALAPSHGIRRAGGGRGPAGGPHSRPRQGPPRRRCGECGTASRRTQPGRGRRRD